MRRFGAVPRESAEPDHGSRKTSPSALRESFTTSPSAVTISRAEIAVARFPFFSPEPCVAVLPAPAIEMWGSEARLCSANPLLSRYGQSWPYVMPASTVTVPALRVERNHLLHRLQGKQVVTAVRNGVEAMARAKHLHFVLGPQKRADLIERCGFVQVVRTVERFPPS